MPWFFSPPMATIKSSAFGSSSSSSICLKLFLFSPPTSCTPSSLYSSLNCSTNRSSTPPSASISVNRSEYISTTESGLAVLNATQERQLKRFRAGGGSEMGIGMTGGLEDELAASERGLLGK